MIMAVLFQLLSVLAIVGLYYPHGLMALVILLLFPFYHMDKNVSAVIFYLTTVALVVIAIKGDDFYAVISMFAMAMVGWQLEQQRLNQDTQASMVRKTKQLCLLSCSVLVIVGGLYSLTFSLSIGLAIACLLCVIVSFICAISDKREKQSISPQEP